MSAPRFAILTFLGLVGGFISGGFGIGPAFILNPALTQLDVFPPVASDTGMFVTMYGTITSTIIVIIFGKLNLVYTGVLILLIIPGSYIGIRLQIVLVKWFNNRTSITVSILVFTILFYLVGNASI